MPETMNREAWLTTLLTEHVAPHIKERTGMTVPVKKIKISVGFPASRARPNRKGDFTVGVCFHGEQQAGGFHHIFIHPARAVPMSNSGEGIIETVMHEVLHATLPCGVSHKAPFAKAAKACGLEGKPTSTNAGPELVKLAQGWAKKLGKYDHTAVNAGGVKKQTTRLLKVLCPDCGYAEEGETGYTIRTTQKWLNYGTPTCPCGTRMVALEGDVPERLLEPVESHAVFAVPLPGSKDADPRFQIRRTTSAKLNSWTVIDYGSLTRMMTLADGSEVEIPLLGVTPEPRIISADDREGALNIIDAIRAGLFTPDDLTEADPGGEGDYDDDEELLDQDGDSHEGEDFMLVHPVTGETKVYSYDEQVSARNASGARKSAKIASGQEGALD